MLVRSIIGQQISVAAARSIQRQIEELVAPAKLTPSSVLHLSDLELRSAGLSAQKCGTVRELAEKVELGKVRLRTIGALCDEAVINELTQVKGIGRWTAQMFLIFAIGRLDVFPSGDLGVRTAIRNLYQLKELPDNATSEGIASCWKPFASVGSWYCWRSLDVPLRESTP
jgi:DNA-3-methyladenine glycosylase II